ncbi:7648_t:CDS:2, partial [Cetraspora pellucida]
KLFAIDDLKVLLVVEEDGLEALLVRDISKDLKDIVIDFSKESNNLKDINLDFSKESDYNQENINNFFKEFINNDSYSETLSTIFSKHSNNLLDSHSEENSDKLNKSDKSDKIDELRSDNSNESEKSDNLLNNKNFKNIVDKAFNFERLSQNTNKFLLYFKILTAALLFC